MTTSGDRPAPFDGGTTSCSVGGTSTCSGRFDLFVRRPAALLAALVADLVRTAGMAPNENCTRKIESSLKNLKDK